MRTLREQRSAVSGQPSAVSRQRLETLTGKMPVPPRCLFYQDAPNIPKLSKRKSKLTSDFRLQTSDF
ncbi:hypothetical protein [Moorena bouillonii]|uniref:hypothetical protein n=1 Tax=Moorena bouillonii TaxID=207920 RepID=UPI00117E5BB9|nr:hypothetical protein [Moorena bouillonii]